jgi:hypothetical protein
MGQRECPFCHDLFAASRFHPNQVICSKPDCQKRRRVEYHRKRLQDDIAYRAQCADSQGKWRDAHPNYMRKYRRNAPHHTDEHAQSKIDLGKLVKNTMALSAENYSAKVWFLCADRRVKNTIANAEVIVINTLGPPARIKLR